MLTLLKRTQVWSMKKGRLAVGREHLIAQGIPALSAPDITLNGLCMCPYRNLLDALSEPDLKSLAGNAIC
eukprot:2763923-Alexandrium_andersonii.AAC.1